VSPSLVQLVVEEVAEGLYTAEEGAIKLATPCVCGIFNVPRATACLQRLVGELSKRQLKPLLAMPGETTD